MVIEGNDSTPKSDPSDTADRDSTLLSPNLRPDVLDSPEQRRQRQAIEANLFGASAAVTAVGRFRMLQRLGQGGMGTVYAAYDDHLDRKVAVKLIRPSRIEDTAVRERTLREARALARLSHPNVVHVYEVGEIEDQLFLAMEFLAGPTLRHWLDETPNRDWRETLRVFRQAGEGLAAAHAEGIVHRDFKPHNAMFGVDRRVRVLDFGLARIDRTDDPRSDAILDGSSPVEEGLTASGMLLGTPAYMAPEQLEGKHADARSDQFGFCVALYEALYDERPFAGRTLAELIRAVTNAQIQEPRGGAVPAWVRRVLLRGLARDPTQRFESMRALLDALGDDPVYRRRKWWAVTLLTGLLGGTVWGTWHAVQVDASTCEGFEARLEGVWDDARRAEVQAAIEATKLSYAPDTWVRVEERLDEYTRAWVAARSEACEATHQGEQSGELLDLRMACLNERLQHVRATVDVLAAADETVVNKAVEAVVGLPTLERCADVDALTAELPPPEDPAVAARVVELDEQLIEASAFEKAGKYAEGLTLADAVVRDAAVLGYEPLQVRAWLQQGDLQWRAGDDAAAEATLEQSYEAAVGLQMAAEAASASASLVWVVGNQLDRHHEGRRWAKDAKPWARAAGTDEALATYFNDLGAVARNEGKYEEARGYHERALAIREKAVGPDHPNVAIALINLGNVAKDEGKYEKARAHLERALAISEKALGPGHPNVARTLTNLGNVAENEGKHEEARAHLERALAIFEKALGPDHPDVARILPNLGIVVDSMGKYAEARGYFERALAIREQAGDPDHLEVAVLLNGLGSVAENEGKYEEARGHFERALAILEKALGPDHPNVASVLTNLGVVARKQGKFKEARGYHERALAIREKALGPDHPNVASPLVGLGQVMLGEGNPSEALPLLERALTIRTATEVGPTDLAETRFVLARALWDAGPEAGRDRERAKALAELAHTAFAEAGEGSAKTLEEVQAWQREHAS
jgi:tetratricopeptide (TPR) repeat protein/tRNA A-37 threonylcarbamoyl transferase component Bud32